MDARWILYGLLSGAEVQNFNLGPLLRKRVSIISSTLRLDFMSQINNYCIDPVQMSSRQS